MKNVLPAFKLMLPALLAAGMCYLFATDGGHSPLFQADSEKIISPAQKTAAFLPPPCA